MTNTSDRRERYATAIHDAMEPDLSLGDQEPAYQALIARAAEAAEALADAEQNRQFLTTLANLGIATHRLDRIRDAARLHRQQLLGTSELYAVIEADADPEPDAGARQADQPPTTQPEPDDPTQCSGEEGFCPEHGFHRHSLKQPATEARETVHACPPDGSGLTPCCGRAPFELPLGDRISSEAPVTCTGGADTARQDGAET